MSTQHCPCGSDQAYDRCCGLFISGDAYPETPEQLMRSRYTAYTQANVDYIVKTMKGPAAEGYDTVRAKQWAKSLDWIGLTVLSTEEGSSDDVGYVEFFAVIHEEGVAHQMQERSEFHRIDGRWYYWNGERG